MPTEKTPAKVTVKKKRAPAKAAAVSKTTPTFTNFVDPEKRSALIAEAAYYRAQRRGFSPGHDKEDWLAAEREVDDRLMRGEIAPRG